MMKMLLLLLLLILILCAISHATYRDPDPIKKYDLPSGEKSLF